MSLFMNCVICLYLTALTVGLAKKSAGGGRVVEPFNEFLKALRKPAAQDIAQHLKRLVNNETKSVCLVAIIPH